MFEKVAEVSPDFCPSVNLYKWRSAHSGLQAVLVKKQSPSVQGYFAVASEANDDSGCPHTLEHIVFMGSPNYPYKGLLDKLSATQMSSTNAWTAQDQTCYTLSTAGHEGFLNLLPVYLDHILNATITDAASITEVYHVDGKGEEKGVVFSEMQGMEHTSDSLMTVEAQKMLFDSRSGYATNTGGCLDALRKLKPETIRQYHRDVYRASNLSVIVSGDVEPEEFIRVLNEFDAKLPAVTKDQPRPFVDSKLSTMPSPLKSNETRLVEFPDSSESSGEVLISWLGPHISDIVGNTALQIVTAYLWTQDSGKLVQEFVNVPKQKALASDVYGFTNEFLHTQVCLSMYGVPVPRLQETSNSVVHYLETTLLDSLDFNFLRQCIDTVYDQFVLMAEERANTFVDLAICEFLYGNSTSFNAWLGSVSEFDTVRQWSEADWQQFIVEYVVKQPKACVLGKPSRDAHIRIDEEKKLRLEETKRTRDLAQEAAKLQNAIDENEKPIPDHLINMFPIPDFSKIRFITAESGATQRLTSYGLPGAPLVINDNIQKLLVPECNLALNFENIKSQFVSIKLSIATTSVERRLLPLISVIIANAFGSPMKLDDGRVLTAEMTAQESQRDLLQAYLSVDPQISETVSINVKAKMQNYAKAVEWIRRAMFNVVHEAEHTSILIARHLKNIPEAKRSDSSLLSASVDRILLTEESLRRQSDILITEQTITELQNDVESTVRDLKLLTTQLFQPKNIRGLVVGNFVELAKSTDIMEPWINLETRFSDCSHFEGSTDTVSVEMAPIVRSNQFLSPKGLNPSKEAELTLCAASDSTNLNVITKGPRVYGQADLPALTVVNTFLEMPEGPFWKAVRGPGLAYGASVCTSVQMGQIILSIYSAADGLNAFKACKQVVEDVASGKIPVDEKALASVVATIVGDLANQLAEPVAAIEEKFADTVIKGYEPNYTQKIISEIRNVSLDRFLSVLKQYLLPLFSTETSAVFAVAPPSEEDSLKLGLEKMGFEVNVVEVEVDGESSDEDSESNSESGSEEESESE